MTKNAHEYAAKLTWTDSTGQGTLDYKSYSRDYRVAVTGKPDLAGSADAMFRGDAGKHNPEDLFLIAISSCHLLTYLALCARKGVRVTAYEDDVSGTLRLTPDGGGRFEEVTLRPTVTVSDSAHVALATELHDRAHALCFIAQSCSVPIRHEPDVTAA